LDVAFCLSGVPGDGGAGPSLACRRRHSSGHVRPVITAALAEHAAANSAVKGSPAVRHSAKRAPLLIGISCVVDDVAKVLLKELAAHGSAEVWASGAANHFKAVLVLARAQELAASGGSGLHAYGKLQAADVGDNATKQRLRKLLLTVVPVTERLITAEAEGVLQQLSAVKERKVAALCIGLEESLYDREAPGSSSSGSMGSSEALGAAFLLARGEQSTCRAIKAVMGVQNARQEWLLLAPYWGPVAATDTPAAPIAAGAEVAPAPQVLFIRVSRAVASASVGVAGSAPGDGSL
jgi:hypothetical protein